MTLYYLSDTVFLRVYSRLTACVKAAGRLLRAVNRQKVVYIL